METPFNQANSRRDLLHPPLSGKTVMVVGLGGGAEIAMHLLRSGVSRFHLFDFDTLEDSTVTIRDRDTTEQTRVSISDL